MIPEEHKTGLFIQMAKCIARGDFGEVDAEFYHSAEDSGFLPDARKEATAIRSPLLDGLRKFIADININSKDHSGETILTALAAIPEGYMLIPFMIGHGADPNLTDANGTTPLFTATRQNHRANVVCLIACGASPRQRNAA